jgi:hypothetical protein
LLPLDEAPVPFKQFMETQFVQGYRICACFLGLFFLVLFPWRFVVAGSRPAGQFLAWEGVVLAVYYLGFAALGQRLQAWAGAVENLALFLVVGGLVNNVSLLVLLRSPDQAANFMLLLVACGLIFQSRKRFLLIQTLVASTWVVACLCFLDLSLFLSCSFPVLCACLLGVAIHLLLSRLLRAVERFWIKDQILLRQRARLVTELRVALGGIKTLEGLIPICAQCKMVRNDEGYWQQVESYIGEHSQAEFTHSLCPKCTSHLQDEFDQIVPHRGEEAAP